MTRPSYDEIRKPRTHFQKPGPTEVPLFEDETLGANFNLENSEIVPETSAAIGGILCGDCLEDVPRGSSCAHLAVDQTGKGTPLY